MDSTEKIVIEINEKIYTLIPQPFQDEIEISDYLKIDYHNIFAELITMPLIINQISNIKAEIDTMVSQQKLAVKVLKSNLEKEYKASRSGGKAPSLNDLEIYVNTNEEYQKEAMLLINLEKQAAYMESFYWAAKDKINALNKISDKITPDDFSVDILEKSINNVVIKKFNGKL